MESTEFALHVKTESRTICTLKKCTNSLEKDLEGLRSYFPNKKRFVAQVNGLGNFQRIGKFVV